MTRAMIHTLRNGAALAALFVFANGTVANAVEPNPPSVKAPVVIAPTISTPVTPNAPSVTVPKQPGRPEIGVVSRATGGHFREGLTAGFSADHVNPHAPKLETNDQGLLTSPSDGAFTPQIWAGMKPSDMEKLMGALAPNPKWPATLALSRRLLLTDAPWPASSTLPAIRMEKIESFGDHGSAAHLYQFWSPDAPDARMLRAGVRSLLIAGKPSVACLEANANKPAWGSDSYFAQLAPFCNALMTMKPVDTSAVTPNPTSGEASAVPSWADIVTASKPIYMPTSLTDFMRLGPVAIDAHGQINGISLAAINDWILPDGLSPEDASILLHDSRLAPGLQMKLFSVSADLAPPAMNLPQTAQKSPTDAKDQMWDVLAGLYRDQTNNPSTGAFERAKAILPLIGHTNWKIRALFVPTFAQMTPDQNLSPDEIRIILSTLLATDSPQAGVWATHLRKTLGATPAHNLPNSALLLLAQIRGFTGNNEKFPLSFVVLEKEKKTQTGKIFKNLSELLDTRPNFIDTPSQAYEKRTGLTKVNHYVMPLKVLRTHLNDAKEDGLIGQMILTSLLLLQDQEPAEIDPDVLADILNGMVAAGLGEEARQVATTVLLGIFYTGE